MNNIKRSIIFPKELDSIINDMTERYSYQTKSKLIIELLELGILKFNEDLNRNAKIDEMLNKINFLLEKIPNIEKFFSYLENHLFKYLDSQEQKNIKNYLKTLHNKKQLNEILTIKNNHHKKVTKI